MLKPIATIHLRLPVLLWSFSVLLTKRQKEQLTGKQPHTHKVFGHATGVGWSENPQTPCTPVRAWPGWLDTQVPCYSLAVDKHDVLRSRGPSAHFVRLPTLSSGAARTPATRHVSPGGVQGQSVQTVSLHRFHCSLGELAPFFIFMSRELFMHITVAI